MADPRGTVNSNKFKWDNVRVGLSRAIVHTRSREFGKGLSGTTLRSSIAEAIVALDSSTGDPIDSMGERVTYLSEPSLVGSGAGKGRLQKVDDLILFYFGDGEAPGFFESMAFGDVEVK